MTQIVYFTQGATVIGYSDSAINGYVQGQSAFIHEAADRLGMPGIATAIAGAMAEENHAYVTESWQAWYDLYALSDLGPGTLAVAAAAYVVEGWTAAMAVVAVDALDTRDHADWAELYAAVAGQDRIYTPEEKLLNPMLGDLGKGNVNMLTAIRLLTTYSGQAASLGIDVTAYTSDYAKLADNLVNDTTGLTAKLYGLMIKEADQWYRDHGAYGSDWNNLPQEIKDALYITYTNIGRAGMENGYNNSTANGTVPYEPLPAVGTGGGLNHLNNAAAIAAAIGVTDYGGASFVPNAAGWREQAKRNDELGIATREALLNLRPFAIVDGDYSAAAQNRADFSDLYLADRAAMLSWKMQFKNAGATPVAGNGTINYSQLDYPQGYWFEDKSSGLTIQLGTGELREIVFGDGDAETLVGGNLADHLYGGAGDDSLNGGQGDDHLEGGQGTDTYRYASGEGNDTILDTDSLGEIKWDDLALKGKTGLSAENWKQLSANTWKDTPNGYEYSLIPGVGGTQTLLISRGSDSLTILNWHEGELGITLGIADPGYKIFNGDQRSPIILKDGKETYNWSAVSWAADGTLTGGVAQADFNDVIYGTVDSDLIRGYGGNDALDGRNGADEIYGGDGDDLIGGGAGADLIYGGEGNDEILSATGLSAPQRFGPNDDWEPPAETTVIIEGSTWGVVSNGDGTSTIHGGGSINLDTAPDVIYAEGGDDRVVGGRGTDYISGGAGNDTIWGQGGGDMVDGGDGNDSITGDGTAESGFYTTTSNPGDDQLFGGAGNDYLNGGGGDDALSGDGDMDHLEGGVGNDILDGGTEADLLRGGEDEDYLAGGEGDDELQGDSVDLAGEFHGDDYLDGGAGIDLLLGQGGSDYLDGGAGNDELQGDDVDLAGELHGDDILIGGDGNDVLIGQGGVDDLDGGLGDDHIQGDYAGLGGVFHGNDTLNGGDGNDTLFGQGGSDALSGGEGSDHLEGDESALSGEFHGDDTLDGEGGNDLLFGQGGNDVLDGGTGDDELQGDAYNLAPEFHGNDTLYGGDGYDRLFGQGGADTLDGGVGDDQLQGDGAAVSGEYHGNDTLYGGEGSDLLFGQGGDDILDGGAGADELQGDDTSVSTAFHGNDTLSGGDGDDRLFGQGGADTLDGGNDNDILVGEAGNDQLIGGFGDDQLQGDSLDTAPMEQGADVLDGGDGNDTLYGFGQGDILYGGEGNDTLRGDYNAATLDGLYHGDDTLDGGNGNDTLFGDGGNDTLLGGDGNDTLIGDNPSNQPMAVEYQGNDTLDGGAGVDSLWGGGGNDTLMGGADNDTLSGDIGNDILNGGIGDDTLYGGDGDDTLIGGDGDDFLSCGVGNDSMDGGAGDDIYYYDLGSGIKHITDSGGDNLLVLRGGIGLNVIRLGLGSLAISTGTPGDEIHLDGVNYDDLANSSPIGRIQFTNGQTMSVAEVIESVGIDIPATPDADSLTGTSGRDNIAALDGDDVVTAKGGDDLLDLGAGNDTADAGDGNDDVVAGDGNDTVHAGSGDDQIVGGSGADVLYGEAGSDNLMGGEGDDTLSGGEGGDVLDGGAGGDAMAGGAGDDLYRVTEAGDTVTESAADGIDSVETALDFVLGDNLENLTLVAGSSAVVATGNELDNRLEGNANANALSGLAGNDVLIGGAGNDTLDGGAGVDQMTGGMGNDLYAVDNAADTIVESVDEGTDTVQAFASYTLSENVENLDLIGTGAMQGVGNSLNNTITGNDANNLLDGGAGADTLIGGVGDDVYYVDQADDVIVEHAGEGIDTVHIAFGYTLAANIENLTLDVEAGYADGTGNDLANHLVGNEFSNRLDGGGGADIMEGGLGDDTYVVDSASDQIVENAEGGWDTVEAGYTYALGTNLENLTLTGTANIDGTGNDLDNQLIGNDGNNTLDGGVGSDTLEGGLGDDTYFTGEGDWINEGWDEGSDTEIRAHDTYYYLADGVENLTLTGTVRFGNGNGLDNHLVGNDADNVLVGYDGNDSLDGGAGADVLFGSAGQDTLAGGAGDDYYQLDDADDTLVELVGEGNDFVRSAVSWTLGDNLENLALDGGDDLEATGNALGNGLFGNAGHNVLTGGLGNDYLEGGEGEDLYVFNRGDGQDIIDDTDLAGGFDTLSFGEGIADTDVLAFQYGNNLFFKVKNSSDQVGFINYYAADEVVDGVTFDHKVDQVEFANGVTWDQAMIQTIVDRATNNHAPTVNSYLPTLQARAGSAFSYTVAANTITDPDPWDSVTYSAKMQDGSALPSWLTFDPVSRTFSGTPGAGDVGTLHFMLWGTDNYNYSMGEYVTVNVGAANRAPVLSTPLADQAAAEGGPFSYTVPSGAFTDPDAGDTLTYSATLADGGALPAWLTFNAATRAFGGTPPTGSIGTVSVRVTARDTGNLGVSDEFNLVVSVQNLTLNGTSGADTLNGGAGNDTLNGNAGNDTLNGNAGNDTLNGGTGNDTMRGGLGNDTYVVDSASDVVTENANEGTDLVQSAVTLTLAANVENLTLTGTSAINGTGNALDNVLTGNSAKNSLTGGAGNDRIDGGSGTDTMVGGTGDDSYFVNVSTDKTTESANEGNDTVNAGITLTLGNNLENLILTGATAINGTGNTLTNYLRGNGANNTLNGSGGNDLLEGGAGNDTLTDTSGKAYMNGGAGTDTFTGGTGNELFIGGAGNDALTTGTGADLIAFNRGDGVDTVNGGTGTDNTVSLGGGIRYVDLTLSKSSNDLVLNLGGSETITFKNWYVTTANNKTVAKLQLVLDATADYAPSGGDPLYDNKVEQFDFAGLVTQFDAARAANPALTGWALTNALTAFHLGGSDTAALGGDLAYWYGKNGGLTGMNVSSAQEVVNDANFGTGNQTLRSFGGISGGMAALG